MLPCRWAVAVAPSRRADARLLCALPFLASSEQTRPPLAAAHDDRNPSGRVARLLSGSSVRWINCQPDSCQRVYFANHTSHLDAIVVWSAMPHAIRPLVRPVAAKDYWEKSAIRRYLARTFNALLIDRTDIKVHQSPVDLMIREIGDKYSLIVFPEGSRGAEAEVGEFKSGLYYLSKKRPDLELVPVHIDNMNRVLPRGEFLPVPLLSCISFGPPMWLEAGEPKVEFLKRAREAVLSLKEA